jgi:bisphosphoglycerate-dependent phosphoglycerate mutase
MGDRLLVLVRHGQSEWIGESIHRLEGPRPDGAGHPRGARKLKAQGLVFDIAFTQCRFARSTRSI